MTLLHSTNCTLYQKYKFHIPTAPYLSRMGSRVPKEGIGPRLLCFLQTSINPLCLVLWNYRYKYHKNWDGWKAIMYPRSYLHHWIFLVAVFVKHIKLQFLTCQMRITGNVSFVELTKIKSTFCTSNLDK